MVSLISLDFSQLRMLAKIQELKKQLFEKSESLEGLYSDCLLNGSTEQLLKRNCSTRKVIRIIHVIAELLLFAFSSRQKE